MPLPSLTNGGSLDARSDPPRKSISWTCASAEASQARGGRSQGVDVHNGAPGQEGGGKHGFADAWKKGFFGWEYKKKGADLNEAYNQLLQYSGDLGNPPLLVVSDMDRIEIRTRFTDYPTTNHVITLDTFATPANLEKLRCALLRARETPAREDDREDHRGGRQETGGAGPEHADGSPTRRRLPTSWTA